MGSLLFACSSPDPGGTGETTLNSPLGLLEPPFFHNMGLCGRFGGNTNAWKHSGPIALIWTLDFGVCAFPPNGDRGGELERERKREARSLREKEGGSDKREGERERGR